MPFSCFFVSIGSLIYSVTTALTIQMPEEMQKRQSCRIPCGFDGLLCCPSGSVCSTDANNQAACQAPLIAPTDLPTPPLPATPTPETSRTSASLSSLASVEVDSSTPSPEPLAPTGLSTLPLSSASQTHATSTADSLQSPTALPSPPSPRSAMSSGAIAGTSLGAIFGIGLVALLVFLVLKRRARVTDREQNTGDSADAPEVLETEHDMHGASALADAEKNLPAELEDARRDGVTEIDGRGVSELAGPVAELDGEKMGR